METLSKNCEEFGCLEKGNALCELARKTGSLFRKQSAAEKRRLPGFVLLNCSAAGRKTAVLDQAVSTGTLNDKHNTDDRERPSEH